MKRTVLIMAFIAATFSLSAQSEMERVLADVEENNASLVALRKLRDAQIIEAKVGNSLEDPQIEFERKWGDPSSLGKTGEILVSQPFDLPMVYAHRNKLAKLQSEKYGYEYLSARQALLLEAQTLYIEAVNLKRIVSVLEFLSASAKEIAGVYAKKLAEGDANILQFNEANFTLIEQDNILKMTQVELKSRLERVAGLNGGQDLEISMEDFGALPDLRPFDEVYAEYAELSPELLALMAEKNASEQDIKLSRSQSLPKLSAGYIYEFGNGERFNGLKVGMSIPMFGNRNSVKSAKARSEYAEAALQGMVVDIQTELRSQYAQAQILREALAQYEAALDPEQSVGFARKALDAGQITIHEYFSQTRPIYLAQITVMELQRDYLLAYARINMIRL